MYEEIKNHKIAIEMVRQMARAWAQERHEKKARKKNQITLDTLKLLHSALTPEEKAKGNPFRKDNPLHRLYFHEIAQPDKIAIKLRKLTEWLDEDETQHLHPVERAARAHFRLMAIFPWPKNSGKVARLLMNLMLLRDGFPPVVIHSIDRQRYYDVLRAEGAGIVPLVFESLENGVETSARFFSELEEARRHETRAHKRSA
jgi:Fic family protein